MYTVNISVTPPQCTVTLPTGLPTGRFKCIAVCRPNFSAATPVLDVQVQSPALVNCLRTDNGSWFTIGVVDENRFDTVAFTVEDPAGKQVQIRLVDAGDTNTPATAAEEFNLILRLETLS